MPRFEVPSNMTNYCYSYQKLNLTKPAHGIEYYPIVNSSILHHLILYGCPGGSPLEAIPELKNNAVVCDLDVSQVCPIFTTGWAVGGLGQVYPEDVGQRFGNNDTTHFILEAHYSNMDQVEHVQDQSGFRLKLTEELRPRELNVFTLGYSVPNLTVPAHEVNYEAILECPAECTKRFPQEGVTVFSSLFHMHLRGRNGRTRIIRDGVELPLLGEIQHFDFRYQNPVNAPIGVEIQRGDRLIHYCGYDTTYVPMFTIDGAQSHIGRMTSR